MTNPNDEQSAPNIIALTWQCPDCRKTIKTIQVKRRSIIYHCPHCKYHQATKPTTKKAKNLTRRVNRKMKQRRKQMRNSPPTAGQ